MTGSARVWDPTGSTAANTIMMTQKTGDVQADGDVTSTRLPDKKTAATTIGHHAFRRRAFAGEGGADDIEGQQQQIRYEGNALMWQGSNRIRRIASTSTARTGVCRRKAMSFTQLLDKAETQKQKKGTDVHDRQSAADGYIWTKSGSRTIKGGVVLTRGTMVVNSRELRAFLERGREGAARVWTMRLPTAQ